MPIEDNYQPKYVESLEDVPIAGPDISYDDGDKRLALYHAESKLELDVNDGQEIPSDELTDSHKSAAMYLATHILTHAAADPADVTLGDMSSPGTEIDYSSHYLESYNNIIDSIQSANLGSGTQNSVAVNSGSPRSFDPT